MFRKNSFFNRTKYKYHQSNKFSSKEYNNPFFTKERSKAKIRKKNLAIYFKLIGVLIFAIMLLLIWVLFYSRFFAITNIEINNQGRIPKEVIETTIREQMVNSQLILMPQKNIFFFSKNALRKNLETKYSFTTLEIQKKLPQTLIVNVTEKLYVAIWHEDDKYFYIDDNGKIVSETNVLDINGKNYPLIYNLSIKKESNNQAPIEVNDLKFVIGVQQKLDAFKDEFKIISYTLDNDMYTIKANVENGPKIYFSTQRDIDQQIEKLLLIKREELKDNFFKKEYINVKIQGRVYIK
ncbi:MAG: FtsQ-type POTRA domain-containing protein [Candidatus Falkowbacteria bacterium]|nr:FtsQ-type POTRA domain-containing protein [Candidatus Falkowbacteria bacterium]